MQTMSLLRRKTRSSLRSTSPIDANKEDNHVSLTSNGGCTHPKEMFAPDRATRSRTSSESLIILELPKSSRLKKLHYQAKSGKNVDSSLALDRASKQVNNVSSSGSPPPQLNDSTPGASRRTRRRSGRLSGDSIEKEPRKTSPNTPSGKAATRSERRRKRSGNDSESNFPVGVVVDNKNVKSDGLRHRSRRSSTTEDKSPLSKSDHSKDTNRKVSSNYKKPDPEDGRNFKIPSVSSKLKSTDPVDIAIHESTRVGSRRQTSGKLATNIDKVLSVDVDVTSHDALHTRTSPRRSKVSPMSDRKKETDKILLTNNAAGKEAPVSPRTRSMIAAPKQGQDVETSDSSRKRQPSGNQTLESDTVATHSSRKRRRTDSVCRDISSQFEITKCEKEDKSCSDVHDAKETTNDKLFSTTNKKDEDSAGDVLNALNLQRIQDEGDVQISHKNGSSTPTSSPRKSTALSPARSPSRRGLRSAGVAADLPSDGTESNPAEDSKQLDSLEEAKVSSVESVDVATVEEESPQRTEENQCEPLHTAEPLDTAELLLTAGDTQDIKPVIEDFEEFQGEAWYEDVEDTELFFFESDHVALKGNRDYRMMLRTLATLEAQRKQAVLDLDLLVDKKREALQDPVTFAQKLQKRDDVGLPAPQKVVVSPDINWERYLGAAEAIEIAGFKHQTRGSKFTINKPSTSTAPSPVPITSAVSQLTQKVTMSQQQQQQLQPMQQQQQQQSHHQQSILQHLPSTSAVSDMLMDSGDRKDLGTVRGRLSDPNKPASFNQLWTVEEQRKLEEFLVKYPMEEVEARRWEKIARALGNRTSQQVASRVQKYFIKLTKAGLPVPGRIPNMTYYTNRKRSDKRMHPFTKPLYQPSTFLQSIRPPVYMTDEDENIGWSGYMPGQDDDDDVVSDDETIPVELRVSDEYQELLRFKLMKKEKIRQQALLSHQGYKCDGCSMEPIVGVRWHCLDCPTEVSTDLCQECVDCDFGTPVHNSSHQMEPVQYGYGPNFVDTDYTRFTPSSGDYNYLDPNYNPSALPT